MKQRKSRPWLTSTGVEISTEELKRICKSWDEATWEAYLKWYESALCARLVLPGIYDSICEEMTSSVFEVADQNSDPRKKILCEELLRTLPKSESKVLREIYFGGKTERQVAAVEGKGKTTVHKLKIKGIERLRWGQDGEKGTTREYVKGLSSATESNNQSIWDQPLSFPIREDRVYDPSQHKQEFAKINHTALRKALTELSEREQRILYLRFWCDFSASEIARELKSGINLVEQVIDALISKLKRKVVIYETGMSQGEGPSCA